MDNLYFGIGGEHYVMGNFIMRGYEAVKLSPDIGYDIHVTNKHMVMNGRQSIDESYYLQVKTRLIRPESSDKIVTFYIENDRVNQMISDNTAILVCVMVKGVIPFDSFSSDPLHTWDTNESSGSQYNLDKSIYSEFDIFGNFWLSNLDLKFLKQNNYLGDDHKNGVHYKTIKYNFFDSSILIVKEKDSDDWDQLFITSSRQYLFSITNLSNWSAEHRRLKL